MPYVIERENSKATSQQQLPTEQQGLEWRRTEKKQKWNSGNFRLKYKNENKNKNLQPEFYTQPRVQN